MNVAEIRTRIESLLKRVPAGLSPLDRRRHELTAKVSSADPAARVAGAFATGLVLARVVSRIAR